MKLNKLKIMQCAGMSLGIRPDLKYAGTERIVYQLNEGFSMMGHNTIVAAPADSDLRGHGRLLSTFEKSLWLRNGIGRNIVCGEMHQQKHEAHYTICLDFVVENRVDIFHDHPGSGIITSQPFLKRKDKINFPIVTTLHGTTSDSQRQKYEIWRQLKSEKRPVFFNAVSQSQKRIYENIGVEIDKVILHGVPIELFDYSPVKQQYLFWIGRLTDLKGTDLAIHIAKKTGRPLILAGEVHTPDKLFFDKEIKHYLTRSIDKGSELEQETERNKLIEKLEEGKEIVNPGEVLYVGPVDDKQKSVFYKYAYAMLMPNRWNEPFGLTLIESMATGTPVVGTNLGSIPEIVINGKTGYVVDPTWNINKQKRTLDREAIVADMAHAVENLDSIPELQCNCRQHVIKNFERMRMASDYINFYREVMQN